MTDQTEQTPKSADTIILERAAKLHEIIEDALEHLALPCVVALGVLESVKSSIMLTLVAQANESQLLDEEDHCYAPSVTEGEILAALRAKEAQQ